MNKEYIKQAAEEHANKVWGIYVDDVDEDSNGTRGENSTSDFIAGVEWLLKVQEEQAVADSREFMD